MLTEICAELRNWFVVPNGVHTGTFEISGGTVAPLNFLSKNQYFRIVGSVFNDGVYQYPISGLTDEVFDGAIWAMAVPNEVVKISEEARSYTESSGAVSPYTSESFGGYSYSKATDSSGVPLTWEKAFANRLRKWRKI